MKKYFTFLFLLIFLGACDNAKDPLGVGEKKVETNFKCFHKGKKFKPISFGLFRYNFSNKDESVLIFTPFFKSLNEYTYPQSEVYDLGKITFEGETFDNLKLMFWHSNADGKYYYYRRALYEKHNAFEVSESVFRSSESFNRKLDIIDDQITNYVNQNNYDLAVEKLREYSDIIYDDIKNSARQNDTKKHLARFIFECNLS